jgi:hypothetical protein
MNNVTILGYEKITEKYSKAKYGEFNVIMDMSNGYINATKLCADGGKRFDNWLRNNGSKELIDLFEKSINEHNLSKLTYELKNGFKCNNINGTYVHPDLIPNIACWVSAAFAYKVSCILKNWKKLCPENEFRYWNEMGLSFQETKDNDKNQGKEDIIRNKISNEENGTIEVETPVGYIDILTDTKIIEVKCHNLWKHALGQVQCYGFYYPEKEQWIYLFDCNNDIDKDTITKICNSKNVKVKYLYLC